MNKQSLIKEVGYETITLLLIGSALFVFFFIQFLKSNYEEKQKSEFLNVLNKKIKEYKSPFLLSEIYDFKWDQICTLHEIDDSYPVTPVEEFIKIGKLKPSHWTQKIPDLSLGNIIEKITFFNVNDYRVAFVFSKDGVAIKAIETWKLANEHDTNLEKISDMACYKNLKIEKEPGSKTYGINLIGIEPIN